MKAKQQLRLAVALTLALSGAYAAVAAAEAPALPTARVRYADLDLSREDGARALYQRLASAAARVCDVGEYRQLVQQAATRRCTETALGNAVASLANARVTALHAARHPRADVSQVAAAGR